MVMKYYEIPMYWNVWDLYGSYFYYNRRISNEGIGCS